MKTITILVDIGGFALATFLLVYGIKAGIIEKRILANYLGKYDTGRQAVIRGVFYVILGVLVLGGSVLTLAVIIAQAS